MAFGVVIECHSSFPFPHGGSSRGKEVPEASWRWVAHIPSMADSVQLQLCEHNVQTRNIVSI